MPVGNTLPKSTFLAIWGAIILVRSGPTDLLLSRRVTDLTIRTYLVEIQEKVAKCETLCRILHVDVIFRRSTIC